ncbi:MAG TPA: hypothetical protein VKY59_09705 [Spirillospora sp.]|nr:hypothetical protein [Spirillospora sp.]
MQTNGSTLILKDGRRLGYAEYGDLTGRPVFIFHGHPALVIWRRFSTSQPPGWAYG